MTDRRYLFHAHHGGGWTLVDNDATNAATFNTRTAGANPDPTVTRGAYLPAYAWSATPRLLVKSSLFTGSVGWVTFNALHATAREYPTATTVGAAYNGTDGHWSVATLNGNTDHGVRSWIYNDTPAGGVRFGSVWLGFGSNSTASCNYTGDGSGVGTHANSSTNTCSTWVR